MFYEINSLEHHLKQIRNLQTFIHPYIHTSMTQEPGRQITKISEEHTGSVPNMCIYWIYYIPN